MIHHQNIILQKYMCIGNKKIAISPFFDASGNKILVLLSASVERFGVSSMRDFLEEIQFHTRRNQTSCLKKLYFIFEVIQYQK